MRRHLQQHAGIDVLRGGRDRIGGPHGRANERLLADRDAITDLDRRLLIVERSEMRIGNNARVPVRIDQV